MFITRAPLTIITRDPLTSIASGPHTSITRAPLKFTTRAHYIHDTYSKLTLFHSNILFHHPVCIYLHIQPVSQLIYLLPTFPPLTHRSDSSPISKYIWNTSTLLLLSNDVEINPGPQPKIDKENVRDMIRILKVLMSPPDHDCVYSQIILFWSNSHIEKSNPHNALFTGKLGTSLFFG